MLLLGGPAEPAVRSQDPDTHAEWPPDCLLAVEAGCPVWLGDEDGDANLRADLVHPARIKQIDILRIKVRKN